MLVGPSKKTRSMTRAIEAMPRWGLQSPFLFVPLWGTLLFPNHGPGLQSWEACVPAGYDWEEVVRRFAPVYVSGLKSAALGHLCPKACGPDEQEVAVGKWVCCGGADGWGKNFVFLRKIYAK